MALAKMNGLSAPHNCGRKSRGLKTKQRIDGGLMSKIRKPNAANAEQAEYLLRRHVCYEVQMMRECWRQLQRGAYNQFDRNMNIECFNLHARNLIEFFKNKDPCDIDPRRFTKPDYKPNGNFIDSTLEAKINQQISHLTSDRTDDPKKQLGMKEFRKTGEAIEKEIARFEKSLTARSEELWKRGLIEMDFQSRFLVLAQVASATNQIIIIK